MIKTLFNMFGKNMLIGWYDSLHKPSAFPQRYVFWCACLIVVVYCVGFVEIPFKGKTLPELYIVNEVEQYRLHQNTEDSLLAKDEKDELNDECKEYRRQIAAIQLARWQLMGIAMPKHIKAVEMEKSDRAMSTLEKKLVATEIALSEATQLFKALVAQR